MRPIAVILALGALALACRSFSADAVYSEGAADDMVLIPAGPFVMGGDFDEEQPRHRVVLDAFWIDRFEVTNQQYAEYLRATGAQAPLFWNKSERFHSGEKFPQHPVVGISWFEAKAFCEWKGKRLPTEAEWEKAARGGREGLAYPWGNVPDRSRANFEGQGTLPVGSFPPNDYGLFDMSGNVWEWVSDWFDAEYYRKSPEANPTGPDSGREKVVRGGSYVDGSGPLRVAHRHWYPPQSRYKWLGVRCAKIP
jgi:formylglycine-generating enzyme required for sulfatase activity